MRTTAFFPILFFLCTVALVILNLFAFLDFFSYYITLPFLFLSIYTTLYTYFYRNAYRNVRRVRRRSR